MKDRKFRMNNITETKVVSKDIRERLELIDKDMDLKLQTLANIFAGSRTTSTADRSGQSLCTSAARTCLTQCMSAASPADCSHSAIITILTAMPISRIKAIAQEQSSVHGNLAAFGRFVFG
jgi:hypothetical protein